VGGGITPDVELEGHPDDPWLAFVTQHSYLTGYAEAYLTGHGQPAEPFDISPEVLEDFKATLLRAGVRVPDEYWSKDQDILKLRIKVELTELVHGLDRGNEVETRGDPQTEQAAKLFTRIPQILKKH
jgi:hypothetical protein